MTGEPTADLVPRTSSLTLVAAAFVLFGMFWGSWNVAAADIERELGVSHTGFGALLSAALAGAALMNALGGPWAERAGTSRTLAAGLALWGCMIVVLATVHGRLGIALALLGLITSGGLVDVVMNVAATAALAQRPGSLVRFHAWFNGSAAVGAAASGVLLARSLPFRVTWTLIGPAALVLAVLCRRSALPAGEAGEHVALTGALRRLRRERLLLVAVAFGVGAVVESGVELWGVLYLRTSLPRGLVVGATSAVLGYTVAAAARVVVGPRAGRRGGARGAALGAAAAAAGIVLLVAAPNPWLAGAGLVVAAGGVSMCWPLLLAHASSGAARPGAIVGGVTSFGYLGFVLGPGIVGAVSGATGLRGGLLLVAGGAAFVAAVAARSR